MTKVRFTLSGLRGGPWRGRFIMLISPSYVPYVAISRIAENQLAGTIQKIGLCFVVPNRAGHDSQSAENMIDPKVATAVFFEENGGPQLDLADISVPEVASTPNHGRLVPVEPDSYSYLPDDGYFGPDKAVIIVRVNNRPIELVFYFQSIDSTAIGNTTYEDLCQKGNSWKISFSPKGPTGSY